MVLIMKKILALINLTILIIILVVGIIDRYEAKGW